MIIEGTTLVDFDVAEFGSEELTIPDNVTEINTRIKLTGKPNKTVKVLNLNNVKSVFVEAEMEKGGIIKDLVGLSPIFSGVTKVIAPELETIPKHFFEGRASLTTLIAPKVKVIENYAFTGCKNLKEIQIGSAEIIGNEVFSRAAVEEIEFSDNIKEIGSHAFAHTNLEIVDVKGAKCSGGTFADCKQLRVLKISKLSAVASTVINRCEIFSLLEVKDTISRAKAFPFVTSNYTYKIKSKDGEIEVIGNWNDCKSYNILQKIIIDPEYSIYVVKGGYLVWSHSKDTFISHEKESLDKAMKDIEYDRKRR